MAQFSDMESLRFFSYTFNSVRYAPQFILSIIEGLQKILSDDSRSDNGLPNIS